MLPGVSKDLTNKIKSQDFYKENFMVHHQIYNSELFYN